MTRNEFKDKWQARIKEFKWIQDQEAIDALLL